MLHLRNAFLAFLAALALWFSWLAGCASAPYTGRKQLMLVSGAQLTQLGNQAFGAMLQRQGVTHEDSVREYVECVAQPIIRTVNTRHAEETGEGPWKLAVIPDPTPNAFVLPGKNIGVHVGLLRVAKNDEQLAAVIGHELGHDLANHAGERMSQQMLTQTGLGVATGLLFSQASTTEQRLILGALGVGAQIGILLPFSREHESEADTIGLRLMAASGYDPRESIALWENMAEASGGNEPPQFLSTHPAPRSRMEKLREEMVAALDEYRGFQSQRTGPGGNQMAATMARECVRPTEEQLKEALSGA